MRLNRFQTLLSKFMNSKLQEQKGNLSKSSGFTLTEIMITVAIIGVLSGLAVYGLDNLVNRSRLNSAAQQLRGDMQRCKMAAVRNNTDCLLEFEPGPDVDNPGSYTACFSGDSTCAGDAIILTVDLGNNDYAGVWLDDADFSGSEVFSFTSKGLPRNSTGFAVLKSVQSGGSDRVRTINASMTGTISIE